MEWRSVWRILKCWLEPGPVFVSEKFKDEAEAEAGLELGRVA